ncbi:tyrosine-type recombinase/integrase [uncultured Phycicoccus sp.]|uniref:tyrosine-type recombinase/integrase n=1 Tax=uncultured Phycicoccus sp. TaxID=661422 RepID=UPI002616AD2C|nr:tyrosine-type recombinase/integrase [uncultured Phycicoccus sp.]
MSASTAVLPFQPSIMSSAQLAAVSYLARYSGRTHRLYAFQLREWFSWCEGHGLDPLVGVQRAHVELYIRGLGERGLMDSSVVTMMHGVRGFFRFAHIDGLVPADPAVYARLPKVQRDESRTQGLDRLELIRFLQVSQTITVHHGALAFLLGINALRASEAAAVRIEDYAETLRGHRVLRLVGKGNKPATMPVTVPVLRVLEACRGDRAEGPLILRPQSGNPIDRRDVYRMVARIAKAAGIPRHISPHSLRHAAITNALDAGVPLRDAQILARHADPRTTEHYDRARGNLDRHGVHFLTAYVAGV